MIPFGEALETTLHKLGLAEPAVMLELRRHWEAVAGDPWASQAVPLYLQQRVLLVEVTDRTALAFLRYASGELERRLKERFGAEVVERVELRAPSRPRGRER